MIQEARDRAMRRYEPDPTSYEIERNAGEGFSASVSKAYRVDSQSRSRQPVALKRLKDRTAVENLRQEFELLSKLRSPFCARVLAFETFQGEPALVLEWIDGPTLFDLAARFSLADIVIDDILAQITRGLVDLHEAGFHHGDLHPKNIMIDSSGRVRLLDFALSKESDGLIRGAPRFLAPEIWSGSSTSFESDLFALGVIERGLCSSFESLPARAEGLAERDLSDGQSLLAINPQLRQIPPAWLDQKFEFKRLRELVKKYSDETCVASTQVLRVESVTSEALVPTAVLPTRLAPQRFKIARPAAVFLGALIAVSAATGPSQALAPLEADQNRAQVRISSQKWLRIAVNGRDVGYAPVAIKDLLPGRHHISWKSASGVGSHRFEVQPGETKRLSEKDLLIR